MKKFYYITVLSNWIVGYDRYKREYSKANIHQSTYPNRFYLLKEEDEVIGITKATSLLHKLNIYDNALIKIETTLEAELIKKNTKNGKGWVINQNFIPVQKVYISQDNSWIELSVEELTALAFRLKSEQLKPYSELKPRTLSILPIALACQARCWFCFSESSISKVKENFRMDTKNLDSVCALAKNAGAERLVITGGGEPGLLKLPNLLNVIETAKKHFGKVIMITNGMFLSQENEDIMVSKVKSLINSGLSILSISNHSDNPEVNRTIMGADTKTDLVLATINKHSLPLKTRLICVLQKMGVHNDETISDYLSYAVSHNVKQVCFKELYVSSTLESLYSKSKENKYSESQQVGLNVILSFMDTHGFNKIKELPWGSPVFEGTWNGKKLEIAAYTEPSVGWERLNGICRSWNLMADGKIYSSLEDLNSLVEAP